MTYPFPLPGELSMIEGAVALGIIVLIAWGIWASRKTRRFRAGIFVERNGEEDRKADDEGG